MSTTIPPTIPSLAYSAPALEKGLDILEALAETQDGLTQQEVALALRRSVGEIFRMLEVLRRRGWVSRDPDTGRHALTTRMFELSHRHPPTRRLLDAAIPEMRALTTALGQSAHLVVRAGARLLVVAVAEGFEDMGFAVKLGTTYAFAPDRSSAKVLTAFGGSERARLEAALVEGVPAEARAALLSDIEAAAAAGGVASPSDTVAGITDLCVPVIGAAGGAVAALTIPFLARRVGGATALDAWPMIVASAARISTAIGGDGRPNRRQSPT